MRHVIYIYFLRTSSVGGGGGGGEGGGCAARILFYSTVFSLFSTPQAGLATNLCEVVFFGLAANTLNVRETAYETVYYYLPCLIVYYIVSVLLFLLVWCPCTAINVSVQYNGGLLPAIILLTQCYYLRGTRLNVMKSFFLWRL